AVGVAAVELFPLAASLGTSQRHSFSYSDLSKFIPGEGSNALSTPSTLAHIFYPISDPLSVSNINTSMIFAGTLTAVFAIVGIFTRRPGSGLGKWLLFGFALIAVGSSWTWLAYHFIPIFRVFWPYGRLFQWSTFGLAILAGIGLDETIKAVARRHWKIDYGKASVIGLGLAGLTAAQLIPIGRSLNPPFATMNASTTFPTTGLIKAIETYQKQSTWPARVVPVSSTSAQLESGLLLNPGNYDLLYNLDLVSGYDSVIPERTVAVAKYIEGQPLQSLTSDQSQAFWLLPNEASIRYGELARFGISALATLPKFTMQADWGGGAREDLGQSTLYAGDDGNLIGLNGPSVGPRVVSKVAYVNSATSAFNAFVAPNFPWEQEVVLESSQVQRLSTSQKDSIVEMAVGKPVTATTSNIQPGINSLSMTVHSSGPGLLVIPANWDQGWSAEVNGQSVPLLQGNYVQQVLLVPAGTSDVVLRFRPPSFDLGSAVTIVSLVVIGVVSVEGYRRRRSVLSREVAAGTK
ncbi:MAG: YfhO family protein, partial [Acidimicrobiales bacterium]